MLVSRRAAVVAVVAVALVTAACGGSSGGTTAPATSTPAPGATTAPGGATSAPPLPSLAGQEITVLIPYKLSQPILDRFTAETGIKVKYVVTGWDRTKSKMVVANTAHTYLADVAEFDWSFTGQFVKAGWVDPLDGLVPQAVLDDLKNTDSAFMVDGKTYAACYSNDFRISLYNKDLLAKAGVTAFPATLDELGQVADKLIASGVKYPLAIPMSATEGGVTPWYLLTLANGGQLFDAAGQPQFGSPDSAAAKALQWEADAVTKGWVSPGAVGADDQPIFDKFTAGESAILLAAGPGSLATANDPAQSSVAGKIEAGLVPGRTGPGASFGLAEGMSIPSTAKHKEAAAAFIAWWEKPENAIAIYTDQGSLPCGASTLAQLSSSGQLQGGDVVGEELSHVGPLFPGGAPIWYSQFSSDAQGLINAAAKGDKPVDAALSELAGKVASYSTAG